MPARRRGVVISVPTPRAGARSVAPGSGAQRAVPTTHVPLARAPAPSPNVPEWDMASDFSPSDIRSLHTDVADLPDVPAETVSPSTPSAESAPGAGTDRLPWDNELEHIEPAVPRRKKWYVVLAGLKVGIWGSWVDMAAYVDGVPGNVHQSFKNRAEAEEYYYSNKELGRVLLLSL